MNKEGLPPGGLLAKAADGDFQYHVAAPDRRSHIRGANAESGDER
jgi:hypothetical protein